MVADLGYPPSIAFAQIMSLVSLVGLVPAI